MSTLDESSRVLGPASDLSGTRAPQRIAGTGTGEDNPTTDMPVGAFATLKNGATAIRVALRALGGGGLVATTDKIVEASGWFHWKVERHTRVCAVEAADGSSAYEAWVWQSSPGTANAAEATGAGFDDGFSEGFG